jgi:hypothetical protein
VEVVVGGAVFVGGGVEDGIAVDVTWMDVGGRTVCVRAGSLVPATGMLQAAMERIRIRARMRFLAFIVPPLMLSCFQASY